MIFYYILILLIPFQNHPVLSRILFGSSFTPIKLAGVITVLYSLLYLFIKKSGFNIGSILNKQSLSFLLFCFICIISGLNNYTLETERSLTSIISFIVFLIPTMILIDDIKKLKKVFMVSILSMLLASRYVFKEYFIYSQMYPGFRPWSSFGDPNYYSLSAIIIISFILSLREQEHRKKIKFLLICFLIIMIASLLFCASRGGILGLAFIILYYSRKSKNKLKLLTISCLFLLLVFNFIPDHLKNRLFLVVPSDEIGIEHSEALDSSARRLELARAGINMFMDKPLFGIGFGNFYNKSIKYNPVLGYMGGPGIAHSIYIQILAETGIFSLLIFALIIISTFQTLHTVPFRNSLIMYIRGIEGALIGFLISATFLTALDTKFFWLTIFLSISVKNIAMANLYKEDME